MRARPSQADLDLINELSEHGYHVSPSQLERWRTHGLIPRPRVVRSQFGGTAVESHSEDVLSACALLSLTSSRGRAWQISAGELYEEGFHFAEAALREVAMYWVELAVHKYRKIWSWAEAQTPATPEDPEGELADIANRTADQFPRAERRVVAQEVRFAHRDWPEVDIREAVDRALIWRAADIMVPHRLSGEQRNLARHGTPEPMDPISRMVIPLPSERLIAARTLTWPEASLARWAVDIQPEHELAPNVRIASTSWIVAVERMRLNPSAPDKPVPGEELVRIRESILEDLREKDAFARQYFEDGAGI